MGKVYGTLSAAMASLLDAGFDIPDIGRWVDPSGVAWALDYSQPMAIPAIRQMVTHFLQLGIWHKASNHTFGASLGLFPDLKPLKTRTQQARKKSRWQELYFCMLLGKVLWTCSRNHLLFAMKMGLLPASRALPMCMDRHGNT